VQINVTTSFLGYVKNQKKGQEQLHPALKRQDSKKLAEYNQGYIPCQQKFSDLKEHLIFMLNVVNSYCRRKQHWHFPNIKGKMCHDDRESQRGPQN
jgi:hypothetical protein